MEVREWALAAQQAFSSWMKNWSLSWPRRQGGTNSEQQAKRCVWAQRELGELVCQQWSLFPSDSLSLLCPQLFSGNYSSEKSSSNTSSHFCLKYIRCFMKMGIIISIYRWQNWGLQFLQFKEIILMLPQVPASTVVVVVVHLPEPIYSSPFWSRNS